MDEIYAGAYLTIIAAGTDRLFRCVSNIGCRPNRLDNRETTANASRPMARPRIVHDEHCANCWTKARHTQVLGSSGLLQSKGPEEVIKKHYIQLLASEWARRGWTFQEQILSRRCVVFLNDRIFWDCQCSVWDEGHLTPESDTSAKGDFAEMAVQMSSNTIPDFPLYLELVCLYNNRDLTYTGDGLRAMAGVLKHFVGVIRVAWSVVSHGCS